ncbi:hypothetical protein K8I61_05100 [bacterium]|nr:hypothetical protein [bacterium]
MRSRARSQIFRRRVKKTLVVVAVLFAGVLIFTQFTRTRTDYENWMNNEPAQNQDSFAFPTPLTCRERPHPDSGAMHRVVRNEYGMRQGRRLEATKAPGVTRIGIFGDSYVENIDVHVAFAFTQPLDYLLNALISPIDSPARTSRDPEEAGHGGGFEILNFGSYGFGPDQSYARYLAQGTALDLDYVVYLFYDNDIADICRHRAFDIDEHGRPAAITQNPGPICSTHTTCLLRDLLDRYEMRGWKPAGNPWADPPALGADPGNRPPSYGPWMRPGTSERACLRFARPIFARILDAWNAAVARQGGRFAVALTPERLAPRHEKPFRRGVLDRLDAMEIPALDLTPKFAMRSKETGLKLRFDNDHHFDEAGNRLAAAEMFRFLVAVMRLRQPGDEAVDAALAEYYSAFRSHAAGTTLNLDERTAGPETIRAIRREYLGSEIHFAPRLCAPGDDPLAEFQSQGD